MHHYDYNKYQTSPWGGGQNFGQKSYGQEHHGQVNNDQEIYPGRRFGDRNLCFETINCKNLDFSADNSDDYDSTLGYPTGYSIHRSEVCSRGPRPQRQRRSFLRHFFRGPNPNAQEHDSQSTQPSAQPSGSPLRCPTYNVPLQQGTGDAREAQHRSSLTQREAALKRREEALTRRETELETQTRAMEEERAELERLANTWYTGYEQESGGERGRRGCGMPWRQGRRGKRARGIWRDVDLDDLNFTSFGYESKGVWEEVDASQKYAYQQPTHVPSNESMKGAFTRYNTAWGVTTPTATTIPFPTPCLTAVSLDMRVNLPGIRAPISSRPETQLPLDRLMQLHACSLLLSGLNSPVTIELEHPGQCMMYQEQLKWSVKLNGAQGEDVAVLKKQIRKEKTRWHPDKGILKGVEEGSKERVARKEMFHAWNWIGEMLGDAVAREVNG